MLESIELGFEFPAGALKDVAAWRSAQAIQDAAHAPQYLPDVAVGQRGGDQARDFPVGDIRVPVEELQRVGVDKVASVVIAVKAFQ